MLFSLSIAVSFLASSVSALATPHGHGQYARDVSLAARHHHIARQANIHPLARRSARRKRCLQKTPSFSPATVPTTSSDSPDVPVNVAHQPPTTTPTPTPTTPYAPPPPTTSPPPPTNGGETHSGDGTFFGVGLVRTVIQRAVACANADFLARVPAARPASILTLWSPLDGSYSTRLPPETLWGILTLTRSAAGGYALHVSHYPLYNMSPGF